MKARVQAEDSQDEGEDSTSSLFFASIALVAFLSSVGAKSAYSAYQSTSCWDSFDAARLRVTTAEVVSNESVLAWALRHGAHVQGGHIWLREGPLRGLSVAPTPEMNPSDSIVLRVPHVLALFDFPRQKELDCLQLDSPFEKKMAGFILSVLAEYRRNATAWKAYFDHLPSLESFVLHPLRAPDEELRRFRALPFTQSIKDLIRDGNNTYMALTQRSLTCLPHDLRAVSPDEYWWARLVIRTRMLGNVRICNYDLNALVPVIDLINHAEPEKTTMASDWMKRDLEIEHTWIEISVVPTVTNGDEITFTYSEDSNAVLASGWGFIIPNKSKRVSPLSLDDCLQIQEAECVNDGCVFAKLRDEACLDTLQTNKILP